MCYCRGRSLRRGGRPRQWGASARGCKLHRRPFRSVHRRGVVVNIITPAAGEGRRFSEAGYTDPKPFIAVNGLPMVVRITRNVKPRKHPSRVFWLVRSEHLDLARGLAAPEGVECLEVKGLTQGAPCTVLLAIDHINNTQPLLIANSDQLIDVPIDDFLEAMEGADGGMMGF